MRACACVGTALGHVFTEIGIDADLGKQIHADLSALRTRTLCACIMQRLVVEPAPSSISGLLDGLFEPLMLFLLAVVCSPQDRPLLALH